MYITSALTISCHYSNISVSHYNRIKKTLFFLTKNIKTVRSYLAEVHHSSDRRLLNTEIHKLVMFPQKTIPLLLRAAVSRGFDIKSYNGSQLHALLNPHKRYRLNSFSTPPSSPPPHTSYTHFHMHNPSLFSQIDCHIQGNPSYRV